LAAGAGYLVEMVNDSGSIWSKAGALVTIFDLNAFFRVPSGETFSDPRVMYDTMSGRWFACGLSFTSSLGSRVYVAISSTADPTGAWNIYNAAFSSNVLHDQPKLGISSDKVVESWNDFANGAFFLGSETWASRNRTWSAARRPYMPRRRARIRQSRASPLPKISAPPAPSTWLTTQARCWASWL
jgi:hypothetical protein